MEFEMIAQDFKLKRSVALLLFPAVFAGLAGNSVFAQEAKLRLAPATSSNAAVKSNRGENSAPPAVSLESKEHGLTQEAPTIARGVLYHGTGIDPDLRYPPYSSPKVSRELVAS
jgi:hypothetical protein